VHRSLRLLVCLLVVAPSLAAVKPKPKAKPGELWSLKPVVRPEVPADATSSSNPIDAFVSAEYKARGLKPVGPADKRTLLRRVYLDLVGIPPTPAEQDAFLQDNSSDAYEKVVDRLLASEQHGVRYARHWLDVLRYADVDERMVAAPGMYLWRDWVINALNEDVPYDQFVRAQLTGYRSTVRTQMSATGFRSKVEPRPDDLFALGFLSRGEVIRDKATGELPIAAVETVSTAFMGLTVGCAKCHDHFYDPISEHDFYAMKALFDPLVTRKVLLGTPTDLIAAGKAQAEAERRRAPVQAELDALVAPYKKKLYDDRVAMLPDDVRPIILKPDGKGLRAMTLRYPYEVRDQQEYFSEIPDVKVSGEMLKLAEHIVETKLGDFDPNEFVDHYQNAVVELIKQKQSGKPLSKTAAKAPAAQTGNIIDLLKRSMELEDKRGKKVKAPSLAPALPKGKSKQRAKAS